MLLFIHFSSVAQSCPTLCNPMNHSTPGLPVHHQLPESTQTHVPCVGDAIHPSHPLSSPSPPALNLSQHQEMSQLFSSGGQSTGASALAAVLPMNIQDISFRIDWLDLLPVQGTLKSFLPTPQFKSINSLALSFLYSLTLTSIHDHWKNHSFD